MDVDTADRMSWMSRAVEVVGRERDLRLIERFLASAMVEGGALVLCGEPGVGKTVLLDAAAHAATARGTRVLRAAGLHVEAHVGFSGLHQLCAPLIDELERQDPVHRSALAAALGYRDGPVPSRMVVSTAVLDLLRRAATGSPMLVVVDDLPWLDRASAAVLAFVSRRLAGTRIALLLAARSGSELSCGDMGLTVHEVQPLDDVMSERLLDGAFPDLAPAVRRRVLAEAAGNPLAILELPAALTEPQRAAAGPLPNVLPLGRRLQALFAEQLRVLPVATRQLLLMAALDGSGDIRLLPAAGPCRIDDLASAERADVIRVDEAHGLLTFRPPLVRAAVVELSTSAERRRAHRTLAAALVGQPERRAWHLAHATTGLDEEVAALLERAARSALRRGDTAGAVAGLMRAAELSPCGADRGRRIAEAAQVGMAVGGGLRHVPQLLVDARLADPAADRTLPAVTAIASLLLNGEGDVDTAHRLLVRAIEAYPGRGDPDDEVLAEALQALFTVCIVGGGRIELWAAFEQAVARLGSRAPDVIDLAWRVSADPARATPAALADLEDAIRSLGDETDPARIVRIGRVANLVDRVGGCREALWRVVQDGRRGGAIAASMNALALLSFDMVQRGSWDEADGLADEGLRLCDAHGYRTQMWPFWLAGGLVAARRGDLDTARALAGQMVRWALPRDARSVIWHACHITAQAALGHADFEEAYRQANTISPPGSLPRYVALALWSAMDLVEAAVRTGRVAEARRHVAALHAAGVAAVSSRLALLVGGATAIAAPVDEATALFDGALALPAAASWPFERARIQLAYGEHLRRMRAVAAARRQLTDALDCFTWLGAASWAERAGKEMRAGRRGRRTTGPVAMPHLTSQEREIALLAATGLTNKQIGQQLSLSHRTVGGHLYRVFPKLGITSRAALRDALCARLNT